MEDLKTEKKIVKRGHFDIEELYYFDEEGNRHLESYKLEVFDCEADPIQVKIDWLGIKLNTKDYKYILLDRWDAYELSDIADEFYYRQNPDKFKKHHPEIA